MMIFKKSTARAACAGLAVAGLALAGCTGADAQNAEGEGVILQVYSGGSGQFVENYNPLSPTVLNSVQGMVYESLFFFNPLAPLGEEAVPVLGESFEFNEDGTVLTVQLQEGVEWSDGEEFNADDVAFTLNTVRENDALNTTGNAPAAEVTGDYEVELTFDAPSFTDGPAILGDKWMVPEHIFSEMSDITTDPNLDPVGTGPMGLGDFTAQSYLFEKSETFRSADDVQVPGMRLFSLSGNQAATDKLLAGELDWAGIFIPDVEQVIEPYPDIDFSASGSQQVVLTTCSNAELGCTGPQTNPVVRQAMAAAIDREQVNELAYFGRGVEISPTLALVERDQDLIGDEFEPLPMNSDVERATSLLEDDGWVIGSDGIYEKDGERLSMDVIVTSGYTDYISALDVMTPQLAEAGIEIRAQEQANAEVISARGLGQFQVAIDGVFQGPVADPYYVYNTVFNSENTGPVGESSNPYGNVTRFSNPEVDDLIRAAGGTEDIDEKAALYEQIQEIIVPALPFVPIINNQGFGMFSTANYTGWPTYDDQYAPVNPGGAGAAQTLMNLEAK